MQAVGQLAGGVAHDFNNILTAILGNCDLMLMRHTPGDSDYDDIQQIRSNSNRAANLTRQLLAFSRQQTLRPQVLQLPDVVAEVSHLLTRLLGRADQARRQARPRPRRGARRSGPARAGDRQPRRQRPRRDARARSRRRRHAHLADLRRSRRGRPPDVERRAADRRLYGDEGHRHRHRHSRPSARQDLRALLHHQGGGEGDGPRPFHRLRHRQAIGRLHLRRIAGQEGHDLHHVSARPPRPARRGAGQAPRPRRRSASSGAPARC